MTKNYEAEWAEQASAPANPASTNWKIYFKSDGLYLLEDDGTEHGPFNATVQPVTGEIFLAAADGWPSTTAGCAALALTEYTTNDQDLNSLDFDQTTNEHAQWTVWMPDNWDAGTVTFKAVWTAAAGTLTNTYEWNLQGVAYANDDAIDTAWGSAIEVSDALIALNDIHYAAESAAVTLAGTPAAGELVQFRAFRDAANDTGDDDARLLGIKVYYTKA